MTSSCMMHEEGQQRIEEKNGLQSGAFGTSEESASVPALPAYPGGTSETTPIPEPSTLLLLSLGVLGLAAGWKRVREI